MTHSTHQASGPILRADLHVHTCHSRQSGNLRFLKSRDCYSRPEDVYRVAKARGMDLVTFTDHDSIDGCLEFLDRHPPREDFFISEEVSCHFPDTDIQVHLGVYGMTERLHRAVQPLRANVFDVAAALQEAGVFFALNHLLHFYRGQVPLPEYLRVLAVVPALETRNGSMLAAHNELVAAIAHRGDPLEGQTGVRPGSDQGQTGVKPGSDRGQTGVRPGSDRGQTGVRPGSDPGADSRRRPFSVVGGSDAHTLRRVGLTWTSAEGRNADDFLASLRSGRSDVGGAHGGALGVAADAYGVIASYVASLLGVGPRDHTAMERLACLLFAIVSVPVQFLPFTITARGKMAEARYVRLVSDAMVDTLDHQARRSVPTPR